MSTTSLTNLISSFLMAPVIGAVSAQQIVNCMSNDIMVTFKNIFNSEGTWKSNLEPRMSAIRWKMSWGSACPTWSQTT